MGMHTMSELALNCPGEKQNYKLEDYFTDAKGK